MLLVYPKGHCPIVIDTMTPDPTDAALTKWIAYGGLELPQQVSLHYRRAIHVQENAKKKKKRKKCLDAIADNIKMVTAKTSYLTLQKSVSIPAAARYTALIEKVVLPLQLKWMEILL